MNKHGFGSNVSSQERTLPREEDDKIQYLLGAEEGRGLQSSRLPDRQRGFADCPARGRSGRTYRNCREPAAIWFVHVLF